MQPILLLIIFCKARLWLFLDTQLAAWRGMGLPYIETYGTQSAIALITQLMQHGTIFDRADLGFRKEIVDVQYLAAMNPTSGSFTICERAQRHGVVLEPAQLGEEVHFHSGRLESGPKRAAAPAITHRSRDGA